MPIEQGRILRWNFFFGGLLKYANPVRVVESTDAGLLVWLAADSPVWRARLPGGLHPRDVPMDQRPAGGYPMYPDRWRLGNALIYQPADRLHAVWWLFSAALEFQGWYVNLERRTRRGDDIDVVDLELDITVATDRTWAWKDEESFSAKIGVPGYWDANEAEVIRAEGRRIIRRIEAERNPFDGQWCDFVPPPQWVRPGLPAQPTVIAASS